MEFQDFKFALDKYLDDNQLRFDNLHVEIVRTANNNLAVGQWTYPGVAAPTTRQLEQIVGVLDESQKRAMRRQLALKSRARHIRQNPMYPLLYTILKEKLGEADPDAYIRANCLLAE